MKRLKEVGKKWKGVGMGMAEMGGKEWGCGSRISGITERKGRKEERTRESLESLVDRGFNRILREKGDKGVDWRKGMMDVA